MFFIFTLIFTTLWISGISIISPRVEVCPDPPTLPLDCDAFATSYPDSPEVCCFTPTTTDGITTNSLQAFANKCVAECNGVPYLAYCGTCCDATQDILCEDGTCPKNGNRNNPDNSTIGRCAATSSSDHCAAQNQCDDTALSDPCLYRGSNLECLQSTEPNSYTCNQCVEPQPTDPPQSTDESQCPYTCTLGEPCTITTTDDGTCVENQWSTNKCNKCERSQYTCTGECTDHTQCPDGEYCGYASTSGANYRCRSCQVDPNADTLPATSAESSLATSADTLPATSADTAGCRDDWACSTNEEGDRCNAIVESKYVDGTCVVDGDCLICEADEVKTTEAVDGVTTTEGVSVVTDPVETVDATAEEADCEHDHYPFRHKDSDYCDEATRDGCRLIVQITADVCNIDGWTSSWRLKRVFSGCLHETLDELDDKSACDVDDYRFSGLRVYSILNIIGDEEAEVRGSFQPETSDDCPNLDEYCGVDGEELPYQVSLRLGLYCGSCSELSTLRDELALYIATGGVDGFEEKCALLSAQEDTVCGEGLRDVVLSDAITATLIDTDGNTYIETIHENNGAYSISFYVGIMAVLVVLSFFL